MMMSNISRINFFDYKESIPAFLCIVITPLAYSISDGIIIGHLSYLTINLLGGDRKKLTTGMFILALILLLKFLV